MAEATRTGDTRGQRCHLGRTRRTASFPRQRPRADGDPVVCRWFTHSPAPVAQGIEHGSPKAGVAGSNPAWGTCQTSTYTTNGQVRGDIPRLAVRVPAPRAPAVPSAETVTPERGRSSTAALGENFARALSSKDPRDQRFPAAPPRAPRPQWSRPIDTAAERLTSWLVPSQASPWPPAILTWADPHPPPPVARLRPPPPSRTSAPAPTLWERSHLPRRGRPPTERTRS